MTVSTAISRKDFAGSGSTGPFNISDLGIQNETNVSVVHLDGAGVETVFVLTTDYLINVDLTELTTIVAVESGETLSVLRDVPLTQTADYKANSAFPAEVNESALDKLTQIVQQLEEQLGRSLKLPASSTTTDIQLPEPITDKGLKWTSDGNLANTDIDIEEGATAAAASAVEAATSETNAASSASAAAADVVFTNADVVLTNADVVLTNADVVLTDADVVLTNADVVSTAASVVSADAAASAVATPWNFSTATAMVNPGVGNMRFNNATVSSVTEMAVSAQSVDTGTPDVSDFVATWGDSTNPTKGTIIIKKSSSPATFATFTISGAVTDNTTWLSIPVTFVDNNLSFSASDKLHVAFTATGDIGGSLSDLINDTSPQLGGDLDANGNQIQWSKGADVASATALPVITDGNSFDVTGTTAITSINTTAIGTVIKLHFDGILTLTHDATDLILPGAANITTAAGDEAEFLEYATGDYRCTNYQRADGTAVVVAAGDGWVLLETQNASASATIDFDSGNIDSTHTTYKVMCFDVVGASGTPRLRVNFSIDGGSTYLASGIDYKFVDLASGSTVAGQANDNGGFMNLSDSGGNTAPDSMNCEVTVHNPSNTNVYKGVSFSTSQHGSGTTKVAMGGGMVRTTSAVDAFQFFLFGTNITSGTFKLYGIL